jgi:hypothetical protein
MQMNQAKEFGILPFNSKHTKMGQQADFCTVKCISNHFNTLTEMET